MMQAAQNQLAADRESFLDAIAAVKSWAQGTVSADIKSIAAEKTRIRRDRNASSALAADRIALAADQSKLHADIKAQAARVAQDKPGFFAQLRADLRQWRLFRRLLKIKTRK
jgi:hypothetical protein